MNPTIFIGSSSEAKEVARVLEDALKKNAFIRSWTKVFNLGDTSIATLLRQTRKAQYAIFVARGDDLSVSRGSHNAVPRDNVIFEAGMFIGVLGPRRVFLVCDNAERTKLPSDLGGVTYATYDSSNPHLKEALKPAIDLIRKAISNSHDLHDRNFGNAFLSVISLDMRLHHTYIELIDRHLQDLLVAIQQYREDEEWDRIREIRLRLREFFEYLGRYSEGAKLGEQYVFALRQAKRINDALWAEVKDVAYMLILAGCHKEGRERLNKAIAETMRRSDLPIGDREAICYYAYRYLGVSYMRSDSPDLSKSEVYFNKAQCEINKLRDLSGTDCIKPLLARLNRNFGNLFIERGDEIEPALEMYNDSLKIFKDLDDKEHIAITHLQIGTALVKKNVNLNDARMHLEAAEQLAIGIGRAVTHGRALEQQAILALRIAKTENSPDKRQMNLKNAERYAEQAHSIFNRINHSLLMGRLQALKENIKDELKI